MNELSEMIRSYIHECFENHDYIPSDDEVYLKFRDHQPSEHIIEKEINFFFDGYYILPTTEIKWEGKVDAEVYVQSEIGEQDEAKIS
ncbi:hypothetical protein [Rossellomorea marisflavi]|uniref:hypothetical protein n=1 Tax=Rossellomorea marisflavi TaxID=189381 RepID=UPI00345C8BA2